MPAADPKTLLVVEDNDTAREGLATLLQSKGYGVIMARNGEEALGLLRGGLAPDGILLDMLMPVLDGWHFLNRLKREGPMPSAPIIITTGTILTREWAVANGCQGFIHKPIDSDALFEEVERCLA